MKKPLLILILGLASCVIGFLCVFFMCTEPSRALAREPQPELAWLKKEFNLTEAEFARISALHREYLPQCAERCRLIEEQSSKLRNLLSSGNGVSPELEKIISERAALRATCEREMLQHFIAVSRTMPEGQGKRYLEWVQQQTFLRPGSMEQSHGTHAHHEGH